MDKDIVERLGIIAALKPGDPWPTEIFGPELGDSGWAIVISALCAEALHEIETLRIQLKSM